MRYIAIIGMSGCLLWSSMCIVSAAREDVKENGTLPSKPASQADVNDASRNHEATVTTAQPILHLTNGDFVPGELKDTADPAIITWQSASFTQPFMFNLASVNAVHFPLPANPPTAAGEYGFELAGGDVLFGSLVSLSDKEVVIDSSDFGKLHLRREHVRRLMRWGDAAGFVYVGPSGLSGWKEPSAPSPSSTTQPAGDDPFGAPAAANPPTEGDGKQPATQPQWWQESGHAVTDRPGASIYTDVKLPKQAIVEVELSWKSKPDFVLSLADRDQSSGAAKAAAEFVGRVMLGRGAAANNQPEQPAADAPGSAFRIEVLGANVILMRDLGATADLVLLDNLGPGAGRIHWQVFLDQPRGRAVVYSASGKQLGELVLDDKAAAAVQGTGIRLINKRGDIRLERLRVSRWNGELPQKIEADKSRLHRADGTIAYGEAKGYDAQRKQFIFGPPQGEKGADTRLDARQVTSVVLSNGEAAQNHSLSVALQDGVRISGNLIKIDDGRLTLSSTAVVEPVVIPLAELQSLLFANKSQPAGEPVTWQSADGTLRTVSSKPSVPAQPAGRTGRLEIDGMRLHGQLADGETTADATCLVWQPVGSKNGSPLRPGVSGRIVYRDPPRANQAQATAQVQARNVRARGFVMAGGVAVANTAPAQSPLPTASGNPSLHLRVGDNIPCEVKKIDEKGVTFYSPVTDATFVANEKVKAVELGPEQQAKNIGKTKRERLLTLPRMQKNNPPTHLIISKNGDYLRGRLNELNEKTLDLEIRMEARQLPRANISRIVWFHSDAKDGDAEAPAALGQGLVQTLRRDGARLTFVPENCEQGVLAGKSEVLGQCRVDVSLVDQVLFGKAIDEAAVQLVYHPWKLQDAVEPKYVQEEAGDGAAPASSGTEAPLVGKPAPDFELPLLAGGNFKLSRQKGTVVVLDFFATWCGPCVQAMPHVDRVVEEFKDQKVKLVAVNMQEDAKKINDLLERLNLKPTVALDRDGATAEKYGVSAIPQTVVIDGEGTVARLFVGGGPKLPEQLAEAIKAALAPKTPADSK